VLRSPSVDLHHDDGITDEVSVRNRMLISLRGEG
jgi:hypothetical protein